MKVGLPTIGGSVSQPFGPNGNNTYQPGTIVGSRPNAEGTNAVNLAYDDLLAIWDAYNGQHTLAVPLTSEGNGTPSGWISNNYFWSSTPSFSNHATFHFGVGGTGAYFTPENPQYVALEVFADISVTPTYALSAGSSNYDEGSTAIFTLTTTNVASGTSVPYTLSGSINSSDISSGSLSGNTIVNSSGVATIYILLANDTRTENWETLTVTAGGATASTAINDTSKSPTATYLIWSSYPSVNEGSTANFTLTTTNISPNYPVPFTLSGISAADVSGGSLSGNAVVNSSGVATISVTLLNDNITEGSETLTVTAGGASASTVVNDTSIAAATYSILAEGSSGSSYYKVYSSSNPVSWDSARAIAKTTSYGGVAGYLANVTSQTENSFVTSLLPTTYWNGAWIGASDSTTEGTWRWADGPEAGSQITGYVNFAFGSYQDQEDYLQINGGNINPYKGLWDDRNQVTEPLNLFVVEYPNLVPTYVVSINSPSVNEGSTATFTLTTTNLASGSSVPYTLSGISAADVSVRLQMV